MTEIRERKGEERELDDEELSHRFFRGHFNGCTFRDHIYIKVITMMGNSFMEEEEEEGMQGGLLQLYCC